ncbi:MAG TPA: ATP synthase F0 subunit B [Syntrophorhabdaceae bacterium]|nr:ATP synthase F0 subunit B [Syntrophorhabdaceae bacterium]
MIDFNYTLLIQFVNFLILLILLNIFLFKPVLKTLNKREGTIGSAFEKAKKLKEDVENLQRQYEEKTIELKRPILQEKDLTITEAHNTSMRIIEKAREELSEELSRIKRQIQEDQKKVYESLMMEVDRLSSEAAEKILKRSI